MIKMVGGALFNNCKLLILKRVASKAVCPGMWEIPGGHVEEGETDKGALERELFEETGLSVLVRKRYCTISYDLEGQQAEENDYIVESVGGTVRLNSREHSAFRWVSKDEIEKFDISNEMRHSIMAAFEEKANQ